MDDPELKAMVEITKSLDGLTDEQRRNVLVYVGARYQFSALSRSSPVGSVALPEAGAVVASQFADVGDLFDAANPQTEADRVLVIAYWFQAVEGRESFEAFPVSRQLKHLGHPVSNITRALDSMISQTPRLILQTGKSGSAQQARKRYKVTREGTKRVQAMLAQSNGDSDDN